MELSTEVTERSAFPLGKVARCCAHWRCIVTDEVRPPSVGVTAARTFAILWLAAEPPWLPLRGLTFERRRWRIQRGGKPLPSASARANSRSTSGERRGGKAVKPFSF